MIILYATLLAGFWTLAARDGIVKGDACRGTR
jgi:hypothetical protein